MAKLEGEKIVKPKESTSAEADFDTLRKAANAQSPVSTLDPVKIAKGGSK